MFKDKDIVAYLFSQDTVKFGVIVEEKKGPKLASGNKRIHCLAKGPDGYWQFKEDLKKQDIKEGDILTNLSKSVFTMGSEFLTSGEYSKVRYMVPDNVVEDLKKLRLAKVAEQMKAANTGRAKSQGKKASAMVEETQELTKSNSARRLQSGLVFTEIVAENPSNDPPTVKTLEDGFQAVDFKKLVEEPKEAELKKEVKGKGKKGQQKAEAEEPAKPANSKLPKRVPLKVNKKGLITNKPQMTEEQEKEVRKRDSVKFARHTTTNIRFDPMRLGLGVLGSKKEGDDEGVKRKLSNEHLTIPEEGEEEETGGMTLNELLKCFLDDIYPSNTIKKSVSKVSGTVPLKADLELMSKQVQEATVFLEKDGNLTPVEKLLAENVLGFWTALLKFLNGLDSNTLYSLKKDLVAAQGSSKRNPNDKKLDKLLFDIRVVIFILNMLVSRLDDFILKMFYRQKANLVRSILRLDEDQLNSKMYKLFIMYYEQLVDTLNLSDECGDLLNDITIDIVMRTYVQPDISKPVLDKQPDPFVQRLDKFIESNEIKISSRFWGNLVQACCNYLQSNNAELIQELVDKAENLKMYVQNTLKMKGVSLAKAFYLGALKQALVGPSVEAVLTQQVTKKLEDILKELIADPVFIPFFVCFYQSLSQRVPDPNKIKDFGVLPVNRFIATHIYKSSSEKIVDFKIRVPFPTFLEKTSSMIADGIVGKSDSVVDEIMRCIVKPESILIEVAAPARARAQGMFGHWNQVNLNTPEHMEAIPEPAETYLCWVSLINEVYLLNLLEGECEQLKNIRKGFASREAVLKENLPSEDFKFLRALIFNFPDYQMLRLVSGMEDSEVRLRINLVHFMSQFMLFANEIDFLSRSTIGKKPLFQRDQLAAYPSAEEEKFRIIAQLVYEKVMNPWGGSLDVTSLNQCTCGYYYFIGNCGMPMEKISCPECKKKIGGENHAYVGQKNQNISNNDFLSMYGKLEKEGGKRYAVRDLNKMDDGVSVRFIKGALNFKVIEIMIHTRYMLEHIIGEKSEIAGLDKFLQTDEKKQPEYLMGLIKHDYKTVVLEVKSEVKAFFWMNSLATYSRLTDQTLTFQNNHISQRNNYERVLSNKIEYFVLNSDRFSKVVGKATAVKEDSKLKRLIGNWVSNTASVDEFRSCFPNIDLRIITGLKNNLIETSHADMKLQLTRKVATSFPDPDVYPLIKYVMSHEELLRKFNKILVSMLQISNYLLNKFDNRIIWKEACALSIQDLSKPEKNQNSKMVDEDMSDLIERFGDDKELKEHYKRFIETWRDILDLRDKFPHLFNFQFMCHADAISEQLMADILDPAKAKIAYFLVSENNVESLMINAVIQTLCKAQNEILSKFPAIFTKVNGIKPVKIAAQKAKTDEILSLTAQIEDLISESASYQSGTHQIDFNLDLLERLLGENLFIGKCILEFQGKDIEYFTTQYDFNQTNNRLEKLAKKIPQKPLEAPQSSYLENLLSLNAPHILSQYQAALKRTLGQNQLKDDLKATDQLKFEDDKEGLNQMNYRLNQLKDMFLRIEKSLYVKASKLLDVLYLKQVPDNLKGALTALPKNVREQISSCLQPVVLRQLVGANSEKLANMSLKDGLEYSEGVGPLSSDETDKLLSYVDGSLTLAHAADFIEILSKP